MSGPEAQGGLVSGALAAYLEANRGAINHEVASAVRQSSRFDPAAFGEVLRTTVAPVVAAVEAHGDGFAALVSETLVTVALDLGAQQRFDGAVRDGWDRLLPRLAPLLAVDPVRVIAAVTNALDSLARLRGARPGQWIDLVAAAAPLAATPDALLAAGQVAAWRSGMAAYRTDALAVAAELDPSLAAAALGLAGSGGDPAGVVARLRDDPWLDPTAPDPTGGADGRPPIAVGAFRGFGGAFLRPPSIALAGDQVLATDGEDWFAVFADAFGSAVLRVAGPGTATAAPRTDPPAALAGVAEVTGWAPVGRGFVATSALTHAVLFTRPSP